jgi:hypothetical protein
VQPSQVAGVLSGQHTVYGKPCECGFFESILPVSNPSPEFHMGIRITSKTWRAPLQLIDSWLPSPPCPYKTRKPLPTLMQRFVRAGWLANKQPKQSLPASPSASMAEVSRPSPPAIIRLKHASPPDRSACLVISGRMADVCAELDRLAAMEHRTEPA